LIGLKQFKGESLMKKFIKVAAIVACLLLMYEIGSTQLDNYRRKQTRNAAIKSGKIDEMLKVEAKAQAEEANAIRRPSNQ
jgi:hypothetical protein